MDPVLQRFGDVTIQRLEKPKQKPDPANLDTPPYEEPEPADGYSLKRTISDSVELLPNKKFKIGDNEISITEKPKLNVHATPSRNNFSAVSPMNPNVTTLPNLPTNIRGAISLTPSPVASVSSKSSLPNLPAHILSSVTLKPASSNTSVNTSPARILPSIPNSIPKPQSSSFTHVSNPPPPATLPNLPPNILSSVTLKPTTSNVSPKPPITSSPITPKPTTNITPTIPNLPPGISSSITLKPTVKPNVNPQATVPASPVNILSSITIKPAPNLPNSISLKPTTTSGTIQPNLPPNISNATSLKPATASVFPNASISHSNPSVVTPPPSVPISAASSFNASPSSSSSTDDKKYSDEDFSEGDSEEYDSENDMDIPMLPIPKAKTESETKIADSTLESEDTASTFLDKFGSFKEEEPEEEQEEIEEKPNVDAIKTENPDSDDYDYDIKEKLKEMGEISFETVKKGSEKPKKVENVENEVTVTPARKMGDEELLSDRKASNMRRNIREVMDETKLDESTLAAQRQEMERLQRVQEQQRIIREVQRQVAQEKVQNRMMSLLQGGSSSKSGPKLGSTVLVKLPNGETKSMTKIAKRPFELVKISKSQTETTTTVPKNSSMGMAAVKKPALSPGQLTPSVSIAPVSKKPILSSREASDSDSENDEFKYQKPPVQSKPKEASSVPTIDLSSDDDCILVSETEGDLPAEDNEDDPTNSGMHTNDEFNQPDEQGRVVINVGHPEGEPDIHVAPQIARIIKPHQIGGVRFLYDNLIESIDRFGSSAGFGCILAHSMGLGKTLQIVCFSDIFLRHTPAKTVLCIMPINTLQNWMAEFNMWLPTEENVVVSPLQIYGDVRPRTFNLHVLNDSHKTLSARAKVIQAWKHGGGVLLIGYEQYRLLSLRKQPKSRRKPNPATDSDELDKNKLLFDEIQEALVKPGADLVICDEGHRIKNSHASISQALKQMRTKRRVVLTGYPLQNNLMEYWCMVDFVRPNYLGTKTEFCNMFERPIQNGQCIDSTEADIKLMRYRAHVLHSLLVGFVQRRSHDVLQTALPRKQEFVLLVRMTDFQRKLYTTFMNDVVRSQSVPNPLKAFAVCCKIWNHPDVLYNFLKKRARGEAVDIDLEEVASNAGSTTSDASNKPKGRSKRSNARAKKDSKPEASIVPYSSASDLNVKQTEPTQSLPPIQNLRMTDSFNFNSSCDNSVNYNMNSNANPPGYPQQQQQQNMNSHPYQNNTMYPNSNHNPNQFFRNENSACFPTSTTQNSTNYGQNFTNFHQPFWGQREPNNYNQQDYYNDFKMQHQFGNNSNNSSDSYKPVISSNALKSGESSNDSKSKINIISDIKIETPFSSLSKLAIPDGKKINIISDIKLEPKKEEVDDKSFPKTFSNFNFSNPKPEIKPPSTPTEEEEAKLSTEMPPPSKTVPKDDQDGIPYDWAVELLKDYTPGCIENSAKMQIVFCIIRESIMLGDRLLLFSQSLITLDLVEQFLQTNEVPGDTQKWCKNTNYYRLDGSTSALEREKLINEFNANPKIHLFLVSTRAGSLGINLVGANRVVVLDASWNPCHDTQAVCRVYRYGQQKPCFVYRLVMDHCLEKKIYDRQINKQGMSDRIVDECNPDAHLTMKDVSTLCFDNQEEGEATDWSHLKDNYSDIVLRKVLEQCGSSLNKEPFQHESLLVDRKDKQLSVYEKRLAKKGYEREKQAALRPTYSSLVAAARNQRPIASVRPMQQGERPTRWIPAEHWQRQGMTAQEMTLPLDVVIPTNQTNIVLKAGQKVLVLKSPKGVYMQLENGKIVAIKTAIKVRGKAEEDAAKVMKPNFAVKNNPGLSLLPQKRMVRPFMPAGLAGAKLNIRSIRQAVPNLVTRMHLPRKPVPNRGKPFQAGPDMFRMVRPDLHLDSGGEQRNSLLLRKNSLPESTERLFPTGETSKSGQQSKLVTTTSRSLESKNFRSEMENQQSQPESPSSTIDRLEQSTSSIISETKQRIQVPIKQNDSSSVQSVMSQDFTDNLANSYSEDEGLQQENESDLANLESEALQDLDTSEETDEGDGSFEPDPNPSLSSPVPSSELKTENSNPEYNYNGYYGYNQVQTYPQQSPQPPYGAYPHPQHPPYDYNYPQQPQQFSYSVYPQTYPPQPQFPPPQAPPPYAEYAAAPQPPPQPVYTAYHTPYPQQYHQPPPPTAPYPPSVPPAPYPDYQFSSSTPQTPNQNYYPPTS